jgi:hypothetical protein
MRAIVPALVVVGVLGSACSSRKVLSEVDAGPLVLDGASAAAEVAPAPDVRLLPPRDAAAAAGPSMCMPMEQKLTPMPSTVVNSTDDVMYNSNPPSSGPHGPMPVGYGAYDKPVDRYYWLANLARGAVVLLYNCPAGCPEIVTELARAEEEAAKDPDCPASKRVLITPYPMLDTKVAAVAWGSTWKATCVDAAAHLALVAFISDHLGSRGAAPEKTTCP